MGQDENMNVEVKPETGFELTPEKMSISALIDYCHTAIGQIAKEIANIQCSLTGENIPDSEPEKEENIGVFNNCINLAEKLIKLKNTITELTKIIGVNL